MSRNLYESILNNDIPKLKEISNAISLEAWTYEELEEKIDGEIPESLTPLDLAVKLKNLDAINIFLETPFCQDREQYPQITRSMLFSAARSSIEIFNLLFNFLDRRNYIEKYMLNDCLHHACVNLNGIDIINKVIKLGAEIDNNTGWGIPLMDAVTENNIVVVRRLVELGAPIDYRDEDDDSAIRFAIEQEHWEIVEYLLPLVKSRKDKQYAKRKLLKASAQIDR